MNIIEPVNHDVLHIRVTDQRLKTAQAKNRIKHRLRQRLTLRRGKRLPHRYHFHLVIFDRRPDQIPRLASPASRRTPANLPVLTSLVVQTGLSRMVQPVSQLIRHNLPQFANKTPVHRQSSRSGHLSHHMTWNCEFGIALAQHNQLRALDSSI
ncbi:MAG: hypothetical protein LBI99_08725 [Propionibacteriaceae bacterium]|nr:hypothetical protein [Propionibacteriaceae bacterium]